MPVGRILEFTSLFDLADGTVRTALSRMVAAGDLVNDDGVYRLAGRLVERQAQQDAGRQDPPSDWDGNWWTVAVVVRPPHDGRAPRLPHAGRRRPAGRTPPRPVAAAGEHRRSPPTSPTCSITRGPIVVGDDRRTRRGGCGISTSSGQKSDQHSKALEAAAVRLGSGRRPSRSPTPSWPGGRAAVPPSRAAAAGRAAHPTIAGTRLRSRYSRGGRRCSRPSWPSSSPRSSADRVSTDAP